MNILSHSWRELKAVLGLNPRMASILALNPKPSPINSFFRSKANKHMLAIPKNTPLPARRSTPSPLCLKPTMAPPIMPGGFSPMFLKMQKKATNSMSARPTPTSNAPKRGRKKKSFLASLLSMN